MYCNLIILLYMCSNVINLFYNIVILFYVPIILRCPLNSDDQKRLKILRQRENILRNIYCLHLEGYLCVFNRCFCV